MEIIKKTIGFDIGTSKLRIFKEGKCITDIPTVVEYEGKIHDQLVVVGKIANLNATEYLLKKEVLKINKPFLGFLYLPYSSIVSVPSDINDVTLRAVRDVMENSGHTKCFMIFDCFVAAAGLNIPIENTTSMIVDCGAGKTSVTTTRGIQIVKNDIHDIAGNTFDEAIQLLLSSKYDLIIDQQEAERIKIEYVDLRQNQMIDRNVAVKGKDKKTDLIKDIVIPKTELTTTLSSDIELLVERIVRHYEGLEDIDRDKIKETGVHLIGNGMKLRGLIELIAAKINVSYKSYSLSCDYMKAGMEKVHSNTQDFNKMFIV